MMGLRVFQKPHRNPSANPLPANLAGAVFHPFDKHLFVEHETEPSARTIAQTDWIGADCGPIKDLPSVFLKSSILNSSPTFRLAERRANVFLATVPRMKYISDFSKVQ
jgi:hypothetical protein